MIRKVVIGCILASVAFVASMVLAEGRDPDEIMRFFQKGRFGMSPDFGLMKQSLVDPGAWDHVATFHSSADDYANCQDAARAIMAAARGRYTCLQLNK